MGSRAVSSRWHRGERGRHPARGAGVLLALAVAAGCGVTTTPTVAPSSTTARIAPPVNAAPGQRVTARDGATNDYFGGAYWYNTFIKPVKGVYYATPGEASISGKGDVAVIGAPGHGLAGKAGAGAAYVYARTRSGWAQTAELTASDSQAYAAFGWSVGISADGATIAVGSPYHSIPRKADAGAVYIFHDTHGKWTQTATLEPRDVGAYDGFGISVSIAGAGAPYTLVAGAPNHKTGTTVHAGAAYVFSGSGERWSMSAELTLPKAATNDSFGNSVAVSANGDTVAITKYDYTDSSKVHHIGGLFVFTTSNGWSSSRLAQSFSDTHRNADGTPDAYGTNVAISGDGRTVMVAAPDLNIGAVGGAGVVNAYASGSGWKHGSDARFSSIYEPTPSKFGYYGSCMALDQTGTRAVVGADGIGTNDQGGLYLLLSSSSGKADRWQAQAVGQALVAPTGTGGPGRLGTAVAMSLDGKTILGTEPWLDVGKNTHQGAARFFTVR